MCGSRRRRSWSATSSRPIVSTRSSGGRAVELGFARERVVVIDEDLGVSGSGVVECSGFGRLAAEVGLGHAGLVLGLKASRLARNNADWYRLLDLRGVTDTVIGDADGLYHPGSFNGWSSPMMSRWVSLMRRSISRSTFKDAVRCVAS
jgi:hypothetical protein